MDRQMERWTEGQTEGWTEGWKDGWKDRQTLFYRTLPASARGPIKICSQTLGYTLKPATFVYTLDCNVFWIYKHEDKQQS